MYDEKLLLDFAIRFLGYGSLKSDIWLIGPEAGGGQTIPEVYQRATVWKDRGRKETEDLHGYHAALKLPPSFDWTQKIQPTWGRLIRVILGLDKRCEAETEEVMHFQRDELGRANGNNSVLDLSPLISPSSTDGRLAEFGFPWLRTKEESKARLFPCRCDLIQDRLVRYRPKLVLFYGLSHKEWWERISACRFSPSRVLQQLFVARSGETLFALIPHPNAIRLPGKGAVKAFLAEVGTAVREELQALPNTARRLAL